MKKRKKENQVLVIQKYKGSIKGIISMVIALFIAIACYVTMLYLAQDNTVSGDVQVKITMIRDVSLAVISIIATSLLASVFIEKTKRILIIRNLLQTIFLHHQNFIQI